MGSDFNGDGRDDILWLNDNGSLSNWLGRGDGGFVINDAAALTSLGPGGYWEVLGSGDFNGDGRDDILWINDASDISNWLGTATGGFIINDANAYGPSSTALNFSGIGDFNGDGRDDILWWNYQNSVTTWTGTASGGFTQNLSSPVTTSSSDWSIAGVGDFDGDGLDDILWRNVATGALTNWLSYTADWQGADTDGFAVNDANAFSQVPLDWSVAGVGDFNGDGRDDILWRNSTGALSNWLGTANGGFVINDANAYAQIPLYWQVVGIGDYNGDGRDDILWRSDDGAVSNWLGTASGGFIINDAAAYAQVETSWHIGSNWDPWDY